MRIAYAAVAASCICFCCSCPVSALCIAPGMAAAVSSMVSLASEGLHSSVLLPSLGKSSSRVACKTAAGTSQLPSASSCRMPVHALRCSASSRDETVSTSESIQSMACGLCVALTLATSVPSFAAQNSLVRLPPLSNDPFRCEKAFVGNTIGQANGVANTLLDLRFCDFSNDTKNLKGKSLTAALMADAKFDGADLTEVVMSKAYAMNASFKGRHIRV
jgi:hypothetical protein